MTSTTDSKTTIGIDFGGTGVKLGVCRDGELLFQDEDIKTEPYLHEEPEVLIDAMVERVQRMRLSYPEVCAIGVGVPGLVDFERGFINVLTNVPKWKQVHFKSILQEKTGLPCVIENDANAATYAEWRYGAARGMKNVVLLTLGTGVGGGLIIQNQLYRGSSFSAGEVGQMSIDWADDVAKGAYNNPGALEKLVGNRQIAAQAVRRFAVANIIKDMREVTPRHLKDLADGVEVERLRLAGAAPEDQELARRESEIAHQVWVDVAEWLGTAIGNVAWLLNPDAVILGGGVSQAGPILFEPLERKLRSILSSVVGDECRLHLLPARFSNDAGIIGNAALAADLC